MLILQHVPLVICKRPSESMFHTFRLDENNKVILVGNPMLNKQIEDMMLSIVDEKLGNNLSQKVEKNIE